MLSRILVQSQLADLFAYYSRRHVKRIETRQAPFDDEGKLGIEPEPPSGNPLESALLVPCG